jgi:glycosyltransferase involved in cell wall biosynthesis
MSHLLNTPFALSVLICSHNPRAEYLTRVLQALRQQTFDKRKWELLLIDNASNHPLREAYDLSWHSSGRQLLVDKLGKTHALLRGFKEAQSEILVIVDDDNVLAPDYLENVFTIFKEDSFVGVIGGVIEGEFEVVPPIWSLRYLHYLAIIDKGNRPLHALTPDMNFYVPPGAGMGIRKTVAEYYAQEIKADPVRQGLDPVGDKLSRAGDTDLALCAFDVGLARGYYPQLKLKHLIPKNRLEPEYMERLVEGSNYSISLLSLIKGLTVPQRPHLRHRLMTNFRLWLNYKNSHSLELRMERATERGRCQAHAYYLATYAQTPKCREAAPRKSLLTSEGEGRR